jgi:PAS domain S-box-containing protein
MVTMASDPAGNDHRRVDGHALDAGVRAAGRLPALGAQSALAAPAPQGASAAGDARPVAPAAVSAAVSATVSAAVPDRRWTIGRRLALATLVPTAGAGALGYALAVGGAAPLVVLALATLPLAAALGLARALARDIVRPAALVTEQSLALAGSYGGADDPARAAGGRWELRRLAAAHDALTAALRRHAERCERLVEAEAQNGRDLQRQYALVQLLRNLSLAASQQETLERALQAALKEIADYLDWPLARLVLAARAQPAGDPEVRSYWHAPEAPRFAAFIAAADAATGAAFDAAGPVDDHGLVGRARASNLSHWVSDLSRLDGWSQREAAQACALRSGFVIPLTAAAQTMAFLEFFSDHRVEASDEMLELIEAIGVELWRLATRFQSDDALRAAGERLRRQALAVECMDNAVALSAADGRIDWVNQGWSKLTGRTPSESIGRGVPEMLFGAGSPSAIQCQRHIASGLRVAGLVLPAPPAGADARWYELEIQQLPQRDGAHGGSVVIVRDITTERATQTALSGALEIARQASQSKSQFLANMSHEIRTPMNGVLGMAELLLDTELDERQRRFIESLYRSGEALLDIINDILDFSKIEAGKLELESIDFDLRALVEDLIELLAPRAHQKRIELAYKLDPALPVAVRGDPTRLRQVLINIIGNAIKFTERGEVVLTVDAVAPQEPRGDHPAGSTRVRFVVRDTGIGMRPEAVERLFSVFMQADQSSSRRYGGTGLGLAISRQLTQLMRGNISATSRVGEGSVFTVELPMVHGDDAAVPPRPSGGGVLAQKRVLIAEDNPTNRRILHEQLRLLGMECALAENGRQALQMLRVAAHSAKPFDVAVVDMKMPIMDGMALAEKVRDDAALRDLPLVMLTSISGRDDARRAHAIGVDVYLSKPVRHQELVASLASVLDARIPEPAQSPAPEPIEALAGRRVLVVEDNAVNQEVVRAMLAGFGCTSTLAPDGLAALGLLAREDFDVVLMDCQMPVLDGFEAMRRLHDPDYRQHDLARARRTPVIALTANALSGDAERCRAAGFCDYLAKPFRQRDLACMLLRWIPASRPAAASQDGSCVPASADARAREETQGSPCEAAAGREAGTAPPDDILDPHALDEIRAMERNGARDLLRRLVDTYLVSSRTLMQSAGAGLAAGDPVALTQAMHTLKSSSANMGGLRLSRLCAEIEALARQQRLDDARARWDAACAEHEAVVGALDALRTGSGSSDACGSAEPLAEALR